MSNRHFHIAVLSCCVDDWGGSEELWARSIPLLQKTNCRFTLYKNRINPQHPEIKKLGTLGVQLTELAPVLPGLSKIIQKLRRVANRLSGVKWPNPLSYGPLPQSFNKHLRQSKPDFVIIAQGINFDGLQFAYECRQLHIPYVVIAQKGVDFYWPPVAHRYEMKRTLEAARKCYFVSLHNQALTEEQFGIRLKNAEVVFNPVKLNRQPLLFPSSTEVYRFACVGRLFIIDKGQDILLRILSREPWKGRNISVSFVGTGEDEKGLKELAALLNVTNIQFLGQVENISEIWQNHHALLLSSRSEGMALAVLEAMAAGRPVIVTNAGGNAEIVNHGITGYIGEANEKDFSSNMEQAWQQRENWKIIGENASAFIREHVPASPETEFS